MTTVSESLFVKICGVRTREDVRVAVDAGADALGIMHYGPSPRHVDEDLSLIHISEPTRLL